MQVAGKTVVVTGGANGIGEALCKAFHRAGAGKVIDRNLDQAANRQLVENFLASVTPAAVTASR